MSRRTKHRYRHEREPLAAAAPEQRAAELLKLAHAASHDLHAPLRRIVAFGDLLKARLAGKADAVDLDYLDRMLKSASAASEIVSDLFTLVRVENEDLPSETVELDSVLAGVQQDLAEAISASGAHIEARPLPAFNAHAALLHHLLLELVSNAVKFSRPGHAPVVKIDSRRDGESVEISVADDGIGFEPEYAEKIFSPFLRLNAEGYDTGTGLGLTIARSVTRRYGGDLTAASEPGRGATFIVRLPASLLAG